MFKDQERLRKLTNPLGDLVNPTAGTPAEIAAGQSAVEAARQHALRPKLLADIYGSSSLSRLMEDTEKRREMLDGKPNVRRISMLDELLAH